MELPQVKPATRPGMVKPGNRRGRRCWNTERPLTKPKRWRRKDMAIEKMLPEAANSKTDLSRRTLLRSAALPAAVVAVAAAPAMAQPTSAEDPVIALWRAWWLADSVSDEVAPRFDEVFLALPEDDQYARVRFGSVRCYSAEEIEREAKKQIEDAHGWIPTGPGPNGRMVGKITANPTVLRRIEERKQAALAKLAEAKERVRAVQEAAGALALEAELEAADERSAAAWKALSAAIGTTPASALASLHMAIRLGMTPKDLHDDYPWSSISVAIRALSPGMPSDLVEAVQRDLLVRSAAGQEGGAA
jgi:hypothetical protein